MRRRSEPFAGRSPNRRGNSLVELSLCAVLLSMVLLMSIELCRVVIVMSSVANAARAGVRYAIVHGSSRTGTGADGPSTPSSYAQVTTVAISYASQTLTKASNLVVTVTYPDGASAVGDRVQVSVVYPYDRFTTFFAFAPRLGSTAYGVITF